MLYLTPHLRTFTCDSLSLDSIDPILIKTTTTFRCVIDTNKINTLNIRHQCIIEKIKLIASVFHQLEHLYIGITTNEIPTIVQYLLSNRRDLPYLFILCIFEISIIFLKKINAMIERQQLLNDHFIKFVNRDMYLWW
jgi:hypothetical protein